MRARRYSFIGNIRFRCARSVRARARAREHGIRCCVRAKRQAGVRVIERAGPKRGALPFAPETTRRLAAPRHGADQSRTRNAETVRASLTTALDGAGMP